MTLAIGDLQGCNARLGALLKRADPWTDRRLWFAGDLVNRGPHSLESLRRVRDFGSRAIAVLGNHDLHLLATAVKVRKSHRSDTLDSILAAPDRVELLDWVRSRPLAHFDNGHLMVHAGVFPDWNVEQTLLLAGEVEKVLRGPHWVDFLSVMYGNTPDRWDETLSGDDRLRAIVNAFTRMRYLDSKGRMNFTEKESADRPPAGLISGSRGWQIPSGDDTDAGSRGTLDHRGGPRPCRLHGYCLGAEPMVGGGALRAARHPVVRVRPV
jgi:bis(5'-nucleosyl)-tetraphosphatase (symmetrical)